MSSLNQSDVKIRFFAPADPLKPYVSTLYLTEVRSSDGKPIGDWLHPEWANLRFMTGDRPFGAIGEAPLEEMPQFLVSGPTSRAARFEATNMRSWGIGLLPAGWMKLIRASAEDYADKSIDGDADPVFQSFNRLHALIYDDPAPAAEEAERINVFLLDLLKQASEDNELVQQAHAILVDPDLGTVQEMADRLG
ncbi:MAG: AraC family transcriptional regulator, partial [Pseudomonadota bacterium]